MINLSTIKLNPNNPRIIRDEKFKQLVTSLRTFPEMMDKRPIVVDENNMALGGNQRYKAIEEIIKTASDNDNIIWKKIRKSKAVPDTWVSSAAGWGEPQKREFIIKDNVSFGELDWPMLETSYDLIELKEWGVDVPEFYSNNENLTTDFSLKDGDKEPFQQMTFTLADQQAELVKESLKKVTVNGSTYGNENSNGNALHQIVLEWEKQRK